jgi:hypothetical protein
LTTDDAISLVHEPAAGHNSLCTPGSLIGDMCREIPERPGCKVVMRAAQPTEVPRAVISGVGVEPHKATVLVQLKAPAVKLCFVQ